MSSPRVAEPEQSPDNPDALDILALVEMCKQMEQTTPRMRRAVLEYLWRRFITGRSHQ